MDKSLKQLAVLYADVSGSTRLYEQFGDAIARTDLALCIEMLRDIASGLSGSESVVVDGQLLIVDGARVQARQAQSSALTGDKPVGAL